MKVNKILYILVMALTLISCEGNVFNPQINQNAETDALILTKFDLAMSEMMARVWAPIRVFEYHQLNSPFDEEALENYSSFLVDNYKKKYVFRFKN